MEKNDYIQYREAAIEWLNSTRDFNLGIELLTSSKFKPGVVGKLKRDGVNGPEAMKRLKFLIRELVQAWAMEVKDESIEEGIVDGKDIQTTTNHDDQSSMGIIRTFQAIENGDTSVPPIVDQLIKEYADAYKRRDALHKELSVLPEDNEEETVAARTAISDEIHELTDVMEFLYPFYQAFEKEGVIPTEEQLVRVKEDNTEDEDDKPQSFENLSKDELKKLRKSVATKLSRSKNMLDFQTEAKGKESNPMPESPKRVKYETRVTTFTQELERIDYQLAKLV
ncbi:MAG: hypothetical protein ACRC3Z_08910 [Phocaeicola sp.]